MCLCCFFQGGDRPGAALAICVRHCRRLSRTDCRGFLCLFLLVKELMSFSRLPKILFGFSTIHALCMAVVSGNVLM